MIPNKLSNGIFEGIGCDRKEVRIRVVVTKEGKSGEQTERPLRGVWQRQLWRPPRASTHQPPSNPADITAFSGLIQLRITRE
jgi:hypothetical protein